jgi:membrane-associated phospholipid phosphatase
MNSIVPQKLKTDKVARVISKVLSPLTAVIIITTVLYTQTVRHNLQNLIIWLITLSVTIIFAVLLLLIFIKTGKVSSWDIPERSQRPLIFFIFLAIMLAANYFIHLIGMEETARYLLTVTFGFTVVFSLTLVWKVSIHAFSMTQAVLFLIIFFPSPLSILTVILPIVTAWSRVKLKRHTLKQVIGGILLAIVIYVPLLLSPIFH